MDARVYGVRARQGRFGRSLFGVRFPAALPAPKPTHRLPKIFSQHRRSAASYARLPATRSKAAKLRDREREHRAQPDVRARGRGEEVHR